MSSAEQGATPRVELWVRSLYPAGLERRQECVLERLEGLIERDRIASFELLLAGERVGIDSAAARTAVGDRALDRFEQFRAWADRADRSLAPGFTVRTVDSAFTDERYRAVSFPTLSIAEYVDGDLRHIAPHIDDGRVVTVDDRLAHLESSRSAPPARERVPEAAPPGDD